QLENRNRRCFAHVVGSRLERQAPQRDGLAAQILEELLHLGDQPLLLQLVGGFDRGEDLEIVAVILRRADQRLDVLRKTAAAVADAGEQERRPDAAGRGERLSRLIYGGARPPRTPGGCRSVWSTP